MDKIVERLQESDADDKSMLRKAASLGWQLLAPPEQVERQGQGHRLYRFRVRGKD
jgi:hypothetical protein